MRKKLAKIVHKPEKKKIQVLVATTWNLFS